MHNEGVGGCKLEDIESELTNDIEILVETWGCNCELSFDNYIPHYVSPQKHQGVTRGRKSGGFIVLIKKYLRKDYKILKSSNNFVWIEVDKKCIKNLNENFLVVGTYINDITSTYYDEKIFEEFYSDILNFGKDNKPVLITGDFNGRTSDIDDTFREVGNLHQETIPIQNTFVDLPKRRNCDKILNSHGEKIIHICKTFDLKILNGRTRGDPIGNFTHLNTNKGESTIDYGICNESLYECVENFMVLPLNEISDHSKIVTVLRNNINPQVPFKDDYNWNRLNDKFKWSNKNKRKFSEIMGKNEKAINEICQRIEAGLIDSTGQKIQELFINTAKVTLERKVYPNKNWKRRKKSKKWFDNNCDKLKHEVRGAGKDRLQYPDNTLLKSKYHEKLKEYKRTCKSKRYFFWQNKCTDMENSLNDPKIFWKKWKQFSETETTTRKPDINGKDWYDHFANLHSAKDANNESLPLFNIKPKSYISNVPFTKKEFTDAISKLKNNKAEGFDSIGNEMIKNAPSAILYILHNFVNLCLHKSLVPRAWYMGQRWKC